MYCACLSGLTVQIMAKLFGKRYTPNLRFYNFEILNDLSIAKIAVIDENLTVTITFVWNVQFSISK